MRKATVSWRGKIAVQLVIPIQINPAASGLHALHYASKVALICTNVLIRNWEAWKKLKVGSIYSPATYHNDMFLDYPVSVGKYKSSDDLFGIDLSNAAIVPSRCAAGA
jgi:hypothetical protein